MCVCAQFYLTLGDPKDYSPQGSSMRFSKQEYWNGLPFPPPEDLPNLRTEPTSLASPALTTTPLLLKKKKKNCQPDNAGLRQTLSLYET